jgi:hypothetical protein
MQKPRTTSYDAAKRSLGNGWSRTVGVAPKLRAGGKAGLRQAGTTDPDLAKLGSERNRWPVRRASGIETRARVVQSACRCSSKRKAAGQPPRSYPGSWPWRENDQRISTRSLQSAQRLLTRRLAELERVHAQTIAALAPPAQTDPAWISTTERPSRTWRDRPNKRRHHPGSPIDAPARHAELERVHAQLERVHAQTIAAFSTPGGR